MTFVLTQMSRKKNALLEPNGMSIATTTRSSANDEARPRRPARERLESRVLEELWSIWQADPRVPSVKSRRSWAISRNANPRLVDNWFLRRRTCAKKAGQPIAGESYDLPLESPTVCNSKREGWFTTPLEPELEPTLDLLSDDTLVYPPDIDDLDGIDVSSDTIFDEDVPVEPITTKTIVSKEVPRTCPEHRSGPKSRFDATLSPPVIDSLGISSPDLYVAKVRDNFEDVSVKDASLPVYGRGKQSGLTCTLCSINSTQGTPVEAPVACDAMSDPRGNLFVPCPRLDFLPDTLSELSAIPFLFRTPSAISPDIAVKHPGLENWSIVEDELERLVSDGKLDFSFLDAPHLSSMELVD